MLNPVERNMSRRTSQQAVKIVQTTKTKVRVKRKIIHLVSIAENWVTHHTNVGDDQAQSAASAISLDTKL